MKITLLSGGTGTPKLLQGLKKVVKEENISVVVNTGEDTWVGDLYLSPDIDTVLYTLADMINEDTWYGVKGDTFITHETLKMYQCEGFSEFLRIGDRDRALKIHKTYFLRRGYPLSKVVDMERKLLNIKAKVFPMTDDKVETKILVEEEGEKILLKFHDFWIKRRGKAKVLDVFYENSQYAKGVEEALVSIEEAELVVIGPSNPITSIGPILSIRDIKRALKDKRVFVVSPIVGDRAVSGPAGVFMEAKGYPVNIYGIYKFYQDIVDTLIIDNRDNIEEKKRGIECKVVGADIILRNMEDKINLARRILEEYRKN
ncbi:MAG TPA: 2-phospho-L-lactate transferase [Methanothermococcus okinawensis]|uniref:2-phospho-L-lactate transferase n=1 Tax=Methanothermococcus okinawensis TaxID=155863 RepID=A0A833E528_9EURY|nr:2-phospho-L-lactate transferase [Methanothermococcus okinawensis]